LFLILNSYFKKLILLCENNYQKTGETKIGASIDFLLLVIKKHIFFLKKCKAKKNKKRFFFFFPPCVPKNKNICFFFLSIYIYGLIDLLLYLALNPF